VNIRQCAARLRLPDESISGKTGEGSSTVEQFSHRRIAAGAAVGALAAAMAVVAAPAQAASCTITGITPSSVTVGLSKVTPSWSVQTSGCTIVAWNISWDIPWDYQTLIADGTPSAGMAISESGVDLTVGTTPTTTPTSGSDVTLGVASGAAAAEPVMTTTIDPGMLFLTDAGPSVAHVIVVDANEGVVTADVPFSLKRRTTWGETFNASPEPVTKGANITLKGTLGVADWEQLKYVGYAGRKVWVQFKATGETTYTTVKKVDTTTGGKFSTTIKATEDGTWRLYYAGNSVAGIAASPGDKVDVQ
jgi:hypothetical protein